MPRHANTTPRNWEPEEDRILRRMKDEGKGRDLIARELNRSPGSVESRMRKLHMVKGKSSSRAWSERNAMTGPAGRPLDLGEGDARYVKACRAQGGFHYTTRLPDGRLVTVRP